MLSMNNKSLEKFYDGVYKKGEQKHYTKLLLSNGRISEEKNTILDEISWQGKTVLDVGCGTGELAYRIAEKGAKSVYGIDYSSQAICIAKKEYVRENLRYEAIDASNIKGVFDVITVVGVLEHIDDPFSFLKSIKTHLVSGGSLIVTCPNWSNIRGVILLALKELFGAKITLADIHYFTPREYEVWADKLNMELSWKTIEMSWGGGDKMIADLKKRLPPVLKPYGKLAKPKGIALYIEWLSQHADLLESGERKSRGAVGFYHFVNKKIR